MASSDSRSVNRYGYGPLVCKFPVNVTVPMPEAKASTSAKNCPSSQFLRQRKVGSRLTVIETGCNALRLELRGPKSLLKTNNRSDREIVGVVYRLQAGRGRWSISEALSLPLPV